MQTVIIWDQCGCTPLSFVIIDRDVSYLDRLYINMVGNNREHEEELSNIFYTEDGRHKVELLDSFPIDAVKNGAKVIVAGFLP
ncbi:hypothetical protein WK28_01905 [Burkholderia vietnamiensis]|nr:hypothetical protein WK28_01905 [Burkholderia vietnamiensis]